MRSSGDSGSKRFSTLSLLSSENVKRLKVAWTFDDGGLANIQATPVFDGTTVIFPTATHKIVGVDPASGETRWVFNPRQAFPAKRGLLLWKRSNSDHPIIFFTAGSNLYALSAKNGNLVKEFAGGGPVQLSGTSKVAPAVCNGKIITALTGRDPALEAVDGTSGKVLWRQKLSPDQLPSGIGGRPSRQIGGNPWGGFSVDPDRCIAYVTTGNPSPVLVGVDRPGNNPGANSVIAISLEDGRIIWRFQEIAHDLWDLDIPAPPVLATIEKDGRRIDIVAAVTKAGNTLILDRLTGKPIYDWRLRKAPTSIVPGERTASYQPLPILPEPFSRRIFSESDITDIGDENRRSVMRQIQGAKLGFFQPPNPGQQIVYYGLHGGAEWPGASVNPNTGALFVAANNVPAFLGLKPKITPKLDNSHDGHSAYQKHCKQCHGASLKGDVGPDISDSGYTFSPEKLKNIIIYGLHSMPPVREITPAEINDLLAYLTSDLKTAKASFKYRRDEYRKLYDHEGFPGSKPPWGTLNRLNLTTGKIDWSVPFGTSSDLEERGIFNTGTENFGGIVATNGGILFASGTKDQMIYAYDQNTGKKLWSHQLPFNGSAPPMTYLYRGEQYLLVPSTGGGTLKKYDPNVDIGGSFVAFKLGKFN